MQRKRWKQIETILDTALTLSEEERISYVTNACGNDKGLLMEVYELLEAIDESQKTNFLRGVLPDQQLLVEELSDAQDPFLGMKIGVFKITEKLGSGGMGTVYKAERVKGKFTQKVAIKLLQQGLQTEETVRRFHQEQEILASLKHSNIAQLYDGGITNDGLPYLVMEYVDGVPVDQYCNEHRLTVEERITLFKDVCSAVQFAHANLVVHRDLKAQNIYVTSDGVVKVLDFGIAKLLEPQLTGQTLLKTGPGQKFWTPQYASPEQVADNPVTIATDVYVLGVLLHKLLTDSYPFNLKEKSLLDIEHIITETSPTSPSESIEELEQPSKTAEYRQTMPANLKKTLSGDIDALVLKALRKDPQRRYKSVEQFSDDLNRFLSGFPVKARPESLSYRTQKFIKRNKLLVLGTALLLLVTSSAAVVITRFAFKAQQAEARAQVEAAEARRQTAVAKSVNTFLQDIITQADPMMNPQGTELSLSEAIEFAADKVEESFVDQPDVESAVRFALGSVDMHLGRLDKAVDQFEKSLALSIDFHGTNHQQTFTSRAHLGLALIKLGKLDSAKAVLEERLDEARAAPKNAWGAAAQIDNQLGLLYLNKGDGASAEPHLRIAAERKSEIYGKNHTERLTTLHNLTGALWMQGNKEEAMNIANEVLEIRRRIYEASHPRLTQSLNAVSYFYLQTGQYDKALPLKRKDLEMRRDLYGKDHPDLARGMHNLAQLLNVMNRSEEALPLQEEALAMWKRTLPIEHADVQRGHIILSRIYSSLGENNKAANLLENYLSDVIDEVEKSQLLYIQLLTEMAEAQFHAKDLKKAKESYNQLITELESNRGNEHWQYLSAKSKLGEIMMLQGNFQEAEKHILESAKAISNINDVDTEVAKQIVELAVTYFEATEQENRATYWKEMLEKSYNRQEEKK